MRHHRPLTAVVLALALCASLSRAGAQSPPALDAKLDPWVSHALAGGARASFLVRFDASDTFGERVAVASRASEPTRAVFDTLTRRARASQARVRQWLDARGIRYRPLYIVNALAVEGDLALARSLAAFVEVGRIVGDPKVHGVESWSNGSAERVLSGPEWGVMAVHAPQIWATDGARGEGIVIASADTGVEWNHPALLTHYRGWNGAIASHDFNWHDSIADLAVPLDDFFHGTHTTGTMIGDDGAGNQIGVAPGAKWIGCRNMNSGVGSPSTYLECVQYFLAPWPHGGNPETDGDPSRAADIINNSWTCPPSEGCDPASLSDGFAALEAAGIMSVSAAANSGPFCSTVDAPPGIYGLGLVVGATDSASQLAGFSSRGPVTVDGSGRMRPDLSAPGVGVRSASLNGSYSSHSGTSMASPHAAGSVALLWSARPELRHNLALTRCLLTRSAGPVVLSPAQVCGGVSSSTIPNNSFGWGLMDAYAALHSMPDADLDRIGDACDCAPADGSAFDRPGEVGSLTVGADRTTIAWTGLADRAGTGTAYDVIRGSLSGLAGSQTIAGAACVASGVAAPTYADASTPSQGDGSYYLVRARNACGSGGWGAGSDGVPRSHADCP